MKHSGAMSTHKPSDSISKVVNSSVKQKVYSLVEQRADHYVIITAQDWQYVQELFTMHNIHVNGFKMKKQVT